MKRILYFTAIICLLCACHNKPFDYQDFDYQTVYFPFQYPVRTLSLGNDVLDNSLDKAHKFNIGISLGGVYKHNDINRKVNFKVDQTLVDANLYNAAGLNIKALPLDYYSLDRAESVNIEAGKINGLISVQLTDKFFDDPLAHKGVYVIPMRITSADNIDSILSGKPSILNPKLHNAGDWEVAPKDYTLFGVKYVNPYHGKWLRRGALVVTNASGDEVDRVVYSASDLELNDVVELTTQSMSDVSCAWQIKSEAIALKLSVTNGDITINSLSSPSMGISGSGKYVENDAEWGGTIENPRKRDVLYLQYNYDRPDGNHCVVKDTLVFRDRAVIFENERPTIKD